MKMSELILAVGDDNVAFQNLINDMDAINVTRRGTKISFFTDPANLQLHELLPGGKSKKIALVLWLPRDKAEAAIAAAKAP
jgi:hypothetical protein